MLMLLLLPALASGQGRTLRVSASSIERAGVSVRVLDGIAIEDAESGGLAVTVQRANEHGLTFALMHGPGARTQLDPIGARRAVRVCGRPAERIEVLRPESEATPSFFRPDGGIEHGARVTIPAYASLSIALVRGGTDIVLRWSGSPPDLARHRALIAAQIASIRCR